MLRISGKNLNIDDFIKKIKLNPYKVFRKGTPIFSFKPKGKKHNISGINILVSDADFNNINKQIRDSIKFLNKNKKEIKKIKSFIGVEGTPELDFGIEMIDELMKSTHFPSELLILAGSLGLGITLSQYCCEEDK